MQNNCVFTFGSNEAGHHGKGAALTAKQRFGAIQGQGRGIQGNSYAIPTKDKNLKVLPLDVIEDYIEEFKIFAQNNLLFTFYVTKIGTGLAGYKDEQIAPMFKNSTTNCVFDVAWKPYLGEEVQYFKGYL